MNIRSIVFSIFAPLILLGCNQSPFPLAPVQGTVTIDGQPMTQGGVMFAPAVNRGELSTGKPAFGHIQPDGRFFLSTYRDGDGAVVGDHWVTIVNVDLAGGAPTMQPTNRETDKHKAATSQWKFTRITFPRTTVAVIAEQENQIDIRLTSQDIAKYGQLVAQDN